MNYDALLYALAIVIFPALIGLHASASSYPTPGLVGIRLYAITYAFVMIRMIRTYIFFQDIPRIFLVFGQVALAFLVFNVFKRPSQIEEGFQTYNQKGKRKKNDISQKTQTQKFKSVFMVSEILVVFVAIVSSVSLWRILNTINVTDETTLRSAFENLWGKLTPRVLEIPPNIGLIR